MRLQNIHHTNKNNKASRIDKVRLHLFAYYNQMKFQKKAHPHQIFLFPRFISYLCVDAAFGDYTLRSRSCRVTHSINNFTTILRVKPTPLGVGWKGRTVIKENFVHLHLQLLQMTNPSKPMQIIPNSSIYNIKIIYTTIEVILRWFSPNCHL